MSRKLRFALIGLGVATLIAFTAAFWNVQGSVFWENWTFSLRFGYAMANELDDREFKTSDDLHRLIFCPGVGRFHHGAHTSDEALSVGNEMVSTNSSMQGHAPLVEAVAVELTAEPDTQVWVIVDSKDQIVGSVQAGGAALICENKPPGYKAPRVPSPWPPCQGPDERHDPDCGN